MKKIFLFLSLLSSVSWGQSTSGFSNSGAATVNRVTNSERPSVPTTPASASGPAVYNSAQVAQQGNQQAGQSAQMIGTALTTTGTVMAASCCSKGCCPRAIALIVMGTLAQMQAGKHRQSAGEAGGTMIDTYGYDHGGDPSDPNLDRGGGGDTNFGTIAGGVAKDLNKKGVDVKFDSAKNKFVLPNGKTLGPDDVSSAASMSTAGLSKSDIDSVMSQVASAEKQAADKIKTVVPSFGYEEGGGGGGGAYGGGGKSAQEVTYQYAGNPRDPTSVDSKGAVSGLTKDYNGAPIGISNDSIFRMMTRRYQLKERQESFFNGSELSLQK